MSSLASGRPQISRELRHVFGHVSVFSRALFYQITLKCINNSQQPTADASRTRVATGERTIDPHRDRLRLEIKLWPQA